MKSVLIVLSLALCVVGLGLLKVGSSVFADARSETIRGPGVDVFLLDAVAVPGAEVGVEVTARGGERAGIVGVAALGEDGGVVAQVTGEGATWGSYISGGSRDRGSDSKELRVPVPADAVGLPLRLSVDYVVAISSGGTFDDASLHEELELFVPPATRDAQLHALVRPLLATIAWLAFCLVVAPRVYRIRNHPEQALWGSMMGGLVGLGALGYWLVARPVQVLVGVRHWAFAAGLVALWLAVPPFLAIRSARRREDEVA
ncbi:MAG TPA: hypothetical protein VG389_08665 [Myxococcota bacterium]|jgi:hypothetical protein|nr:hypothetical protein [Myxococcota bacterium]